MLFNHLKYKGLLVLCIAITACNHNPEPLVITDDEVMAGGQQTVMVSSGKAFGMAFTNLDAARAALHETGDKAFNATFVTAPAILNPGLGPVYNNVACSSCHASDGRGKAPENGERLESMLFRISVPGTDAHGGPMGVPGLGGQLQDKAIYGHKAEASVNTEWVEQVNKFIDGASISLRKPVYTLSNSLAPLPTDIMISARLAPPIHGLGLLEAIDADILESNADPDDLNGDGISGKVNKVWDIKSQSVKIGRFGWKAEAPTLLQQTASAYAEDMGISNFIMPEGNGLKNDLSDSLLYSTAFYCQSLAVPARRNNTNPDVLAGKALFSQAGCAACHVPKWRTGNNFAFPQASNQVIFPYTDMLLHDMGPNLADNRPTYLANGYEWRTPPLWGIGLTKMVNGNANFLHDGRARSLMEAVLWHGGEAEKAKTKVQQMNNTERAQLIKFLESL